MVPQERDPIPGAPLPTVLLNLLLDTAPVARMALQDTRGRPYALPVVFARIGNALWTPVDGKPKRSARLARLEHIRRMPEIGILLDHYAEDWTQLWWVRMRGMASVVDARHSRWANAAAELRRKYRQYEHTPTFLGEPVMIRFEWAGYGWWAADGIAGIERWLEAPAAG